MATNWVRSSTHGKVYRNLANTYTPLSTTEFYVMIFHVMLLGTHYIVDYLSEYIHKIILDTDIVLLLFLFGMCSCMFVFIKIKKLLAQALYFY